MSDEYKITDEDKRSGLAEFLYDARNTAAKAVDNLFSKIGVNMDQYSYIHDIPIGIEEESDISGAYDPGIYGIIIGRDSDEIVDFANSDEAQRQIIKKRLAITMAHELIHSIQTGPSEFVDFDTVGNIVVGWSGLEEGMAEALGNIALETYVKNLELEESAKRFEKFCGERGEPAAQMSARMIGKMGQELLSWYINCAKTGEYKTHNRLQEAFGGSYKLFLRNMNLLYDYEIDEESNDNVAAVTQQTRDFIDSVFV